MWLDRLPPEYRRRYYTNLGTIAAVVVFFFVVRRLGPANGARAIGAFVLVLVLFAIVMPLVRLLQNKPHTPRAAFLLYGAWMLAFLIAAAGFIFPRIPGVVTLAALAVSSVLMLVFFIAYRKIVSPDLFGGGLAHRWKAIREAQKAEREEFG